MIRSSHGNDVKWITLKCKKTLDYVYFAINLIYIENSWKKIFLILNCQERVEPNKQKNVYQLIRKNLVRFESVKKSWNLLRKLINAY